MTYNSSDNHESKWEKFFKWVNGEQALDSVWEKELKSKILGKRQKRHKSIEDVIDKINAQSKKIYIFFSIIITVTYIGILLYTAVLLPEHGNELNPTNNEVSQRYVENGVNDTGAVNAVSAMILEYRAFDTFGETVALFASIICVAILLKKDRSNLCPQEEREYIEDEKILNADGNGILKFTSRLIFPIVILYGVYVILNGHISPGGGFSGGAIIGAGLILYSAAYGDKNLKHIVNYNSFSKVVCGCLLVYFFSKGYSFFTGGNHIKSIIPKGTPGNILSGGLILPLNICVGAVVACTIYGFYSYFTKGDI